MRIGGIQRCSLVDYPGKVSAVIFTQGCNFRCPYCHNPQLVEPSLFATPLDVAEVLSFLKSRVGRLDGVVVSGGEPLLQKDLPDFLAQIRRFGFPVKLDTNGSFPERLQEVIAAGLVDYVAMDIKAPFDKYQQAAGVDADTDRIAGSIRALHDAGIDHLFRTTVAPPLVSAEDAEHIRRNLAGSSLHVQQKMNCLGAMLDWSSHGCPGEKQQKGIA